MTHSEKRTVWYKEGALALGSGILYGATNALVGHPMDTVKSKMQAQSGFIQGESTTMLGVIKRMWQAEKVIAFYRGVVPPLLGSSVYRSTQFAVYEACYTKSQESGWDQYKIPGSGGLAYATVVSGFCGASARAVIEQPIEYAKVKRQTGQTWRVMEAYQGFGVQLPRTAGLMTFIFVEVDYVRRWSGGEILKKPLGQFCCWGCCSMFAFWIIWPLETLKNQVQAGTKVDGIEQPTLRQRIQSLGGFTGLYRGIVPGSISVFLRNGCAAVVMSQMQRKITEWGLR